MASANPISPIVSTATTPTFAGGGTFQVGTQACHFFYFTDILGQMYNPSDFEVEILNPSGTVTKTGTALDMVDLGVFAFVWAIPKTADTGTYTFNLTYTVETIDGPTVSLFSEDFIIIEAGAGGLTLRQVSIRDALEALIKEAQMIPVFDEPMRLNKARTRGKLTFPRWNQTAEPEVFMNGEIMESGYAIDYFRGTVDFTSSISTYDEITASYNFRWFTDEELDLYIEQGINEVNIWPPQTIYSIGSIPDQWLVTAIYGAAIMAIRRLMFGLIYQQPIKIYGTMDRADKVHAMLETLKQNYLGERDKQLEQKKYGPYTGLTMTVTTPEFTLPGGRSRWFRQLFKGG